MKIELNISNSAVGVLAIALFAGVSLAATPLATWKSGEILSAGALSQNFQTITADLEAVEVRLAAIEGSAQAPVISNNSNGGQSFAHTGPLATVPDLNVTLTTTKPRDVMVGLTNGDGSDQCFIETFRGSEQNGLYVELQRRSDSVWATIATHDLRTAGLPSATYGLKVRVPPSAVTFFDKGVPAGTHEYRIRVTDDPGVVTVLNVRLYALPLPAN